MQNKFRTVRSVTTEATSLSLEVTSFTRTDVSSLAASGRDGVGIPSASRKRRKNNACGPSSRNTHRDKPSELQLNKGIVRPGDVLIAVREAHHSPQRERASGPSIPNFLYAQPNAWKPPTPRKTTRHDGIANRSLLPLDRGSFRCSAQKCFITAMQKKPRRTSCSHRTRCICPTRS